MGYGQGSHLPLLLACSQSMALMWSWKNQICGNAGWNPLRPSRCDVHVHQSWRNIDDFKERAKVVVKESFHKHRHGDAWTNYFWTYYHQFGKWQYLSWFSIQNCFVIMLFILVHCVYVYRIMDGGCSKSAPFQPKHPSEHWNISWCVETLVCSWHKWP
jgi:hypothetical protein